MPINTTDTQVAFENPEVIQSLKAAISTALSVPAYNVIIESIVWIENGNVMRRGDGKVLKGPSYRPPVLTDLVQ